MLGSDVQAKSPAMQVFKVDEYDEDGGEIVTIYLVAPSPDLRADDIAGLIDATAICSCDDYADACKIVEAWNAYHIKN